jgi:hypothetical protein
MMGFTAKGRPAFTDHEDHDEPQGMGFTVSRVEDGGTAHRESAGMFNIKCASLRTELATYVVRDRRHSATNGVRA